MNLTNFILAEMGREGSTHFRPEFLQEPEGDEAKDAGSNVEKKKRKKEGKDKEKKTKSGAGGNEKAEATEEKPPKKPKKSKQNEQMEEEEAAASEESMPWWARVIPAIATKPASCKAFVHQSFELQEWSTELGIGFQLGSDLSLRNNIAVLV